jgi:adenylate cyclase
VSEDGWGWAGEQVEEVLLGGPRRYTREQVHRQSGLTPEHATRLWNALGFPTVPDDEVAFTDADLEALQLTARLLGDDTFDETEELAIARTLGQTLGRLAEWQANLLRRRAVAEGRSDPTAVVGSVQDLVPVLEHLQGYAWRRHLANTAGRMMSSLARPAEEQSAEQVTVVGFADIVGFTALSRTVSESELRSLLEHFEAVSSTVVARHGGRIVKTLGDEVLFVVDDTAEALATALELHDEVPDEAGHLELRIGMARGPVLPRYGDVYGPTVNIASRLTSHARAGTVLVDDGLTEAARSADLDYELRSVPALSVRGYRHLKPHVVRRPRAVAAT